MMAAVDTFKSQIKADNFDPQVISKIHVLQSHNHAIHSTKTYLMVPAGVDKLNEI